VNIAFSDRFQERRIPFVQKGFRLTSCSPSPWWDVARNACRHEKASRYGARLCSARVANHLLSPDEVLARYSAGPKSGVFTDGSCEGNPGPGGWGVVWVEDDAIRAERSGRDPSTTNNRMELAALIAAYELLPADAALTMYSDSQLCVKTVNEWAAGWEQRGWRRKTGPIANLEQVKRVYALAKAHPKVELRWIRAHDGSKWNEYADALSNAYMRGQ
jgi:ribonuclease HI